MDVSIVDLQPGDLICRNGFRQRVRSVESPTILTWPWIYVELEPPENWKTLGWSHALTGPPDMPVTKLEEAS